MKMGYVFVFAGIVIAAIGILLITKQGEIKVDERVDKVNEKELAEVKEEKKDADLTENEEKGREFEAWCVDHFNKKYFNLKEWRGDKIQNGVYAESNRYPDMEWEINLKEESHKFAIECKYRSEFKDEGIKWASEENIAIYNKFAEEKKMPVIVVIGVGGEAKSPEEVYCVPLSKLKFPRASKEYLEKFKREEKEKNFYYDIENQTLK